MAASLRKRPTELHVSPAEDARSAEGLREREREREAGNWQDEHEEHGVALRRQ